VSAGSPTAPRVCLSRYCSANEDGQSSALRACTWRMPFEVEFGSWFRDPRPVRKRYGSRFAFPAARSRCLTPTPAASPCRARRYSGVGRSDTANTANRCSSRHTSWTSMNPRSPSDTMSRSPPRHTQVTAGSGGRKIRLTGHVVGYQSNPGSPGDPPPDPGGIWRRCPRQSYLRGLWRKPKLHNLGADLASS